MARTKNAYSPERKEETFRAICERMVKGESLNSIVSDKSMPNYSTVQDWINGDETLAARYARAREDRADFYADEIADIADDAGGDAVLGIDKDGKHYAKMDGEAVQRAKLRIDTRKWVASKMRPQQYGERVTQDVNLKVSAINIRFHK